MSKHSNENEKTNHKIQIPENFASIISDFSNDLSLTFPEYEHLWERWKVAENIPVSMIRTLYYHCMDVYPERFFDILYQNDDIFHLDNNSNTFFLPNVDFKLLFNCPNVSESTKNTMWKYIQLVLFTIVGNIRDKSDFGKSANLFEGIDESDLQEKLTDAMKNMTEFFRNASTSSEGVEGDGEGDGDGMGDGGDAFFEKMAKEFEQRSSSSSTSGGGGGENHIPQMPNPEDIHNHLKGLFDGKLGVLAKELIEELSEELKDTFDMRDIESTTNPKEVFAKMMKNPDKFMKIIKKINERFQDKMKSGDISREEIMKEAGDMLKKLKEMGGNSKEMNDMFKNMAKSMGQPVGKNTKVDVNAMNRMMKSNDIKERLRAKMSANANAKQAEEPVTKANYELEQTDTNHLVYRPVDSERGEKSALKPPTVPVPIDKAKEAAELDALVAEIEATGAPSTETAANKKKKNGKKKK
jgi:hypothetical protein